MTACGPRIPCAECGQVFRPKKRGIRIQTTCSIKCHVARRNYAGKRNPNWRDANKHVCDYCRKEFHGKRPAGRYSGMYCSRICSSAVHNTMKNKRDLNEPTLVAAAEALGAIWVESPPLDGWIWHAQTGWIPVEIKRPNRKGRAREFTPAQKRFFETCTQNRGPYWVWRTIDDVLKSLNGRIAA